VKKVRLNLGCGPFKEPGFINIDIREDLKPDMVCDLSQGIPFADDSVDEIRAYDFLEHIPLGKTMFMMEEIWRVLKPGGRLDAQVPSTDGRGAFQDPTHLSFWNVNSFLYYVDGAFRNSCGAKALFKGSVEQGWSNELMQVAHVHVLFYAIKGQEVPIPTSTNKYGADRNTICATLEISTAKTVIQGGVEVVKPEK